MANFLKDPENWRQSQWAKQEFNRRFAADDPFRVPVEIPDVNLVTTALQDIIAIAAASLRDDMASLTHEGALREIVRRAVAVREGWPGAGAGE